MSAADQRKDGGVRLYVRRSSNACLRCMCVCVCVAAAAEIEKVQDASESTGQDWRCSMSLADAVLVLTREQLSSSKTPQAKVVRDCVRVRGDADSRELLNVCVRVCVCPLARLAASAQVPLYCDCSLRWLSRVALYADSPLLLWTDAGLTGGCSRRRLCFSCCCSC